MLSENVYRLRKENNMTIEQLAKASGASKSFIWTLENNSRFKPSAIKIYKVAEALGVSIDSLLMEDSSLFPQMVANDKNKNFIKQYLGLNLKKQMVMQELLAQLKGL